MSHLIFSNQYEHQTFPLVSHSVNSTATETIIEGGLQLPDLTESLINTKVLTVDDGLGIVSYSPRNPFDQDLNTTDSPEFVNMTLTGVPNDDLENKVVVLDAGTNQFEWRNATSIINNPFDQSLSTINSPSFVNLSLTGITENQLLTRVVAHNAGTNQLQWKTVNDPDQSLDTTDSPTFQGLSLTAIPQDDTNTKVLTIDAGTDALEWRDQSTINTASLTSAGGTSLVNDGVGPALATKGLVAGTNVSFVDNGTDIEIIAAGTGTTVVSLASAGGTETLVNDGTGPDMVTKGLTAGAGITLTPTANDITIAATASAPFDQDLNTTDSPLFENLSVGDSVGAGNSKARLRVVAEPIPPGLGFPAGIILEREDYLSGVPMIQILAEARDDQAIYFDSACMNDSQEKSNSVNSNFKLSKDSTSLKFSGDSGIIEGSVVTFNDLMTIDNSAVLVDSAIELQADQMVIPSAPSVNVAQNFDVLVRDGTNPFETRPMSDGAYGSLYSAFNNSIDLDMSGGSYVDVDNITTFLSESYLFSQPSNGVLQYDGTNTCKFEVCYSMTYTNLQSIPITLSSQLQKNSLNYAPSLATVTADTPQFAYTDVSKECFIELANGDQINLGVINGTNLLDMRVSLINITIKKLADSAVLSPPSAGRGEIYYPTENLTVTPIASVGVGVKVVGTTVAYANNLNFDMPADNRLRYTGTGTAIVHCGCSFTFSATTNGVENMNIYARILETDLVTYREIPASELDITTRQASDRISTACHWFCDLAQNESVEMWVKNITNTDDLVFEHLNVFGMKMGEL